MRVHHIENGVVVNTIEVDSLDVFPDMLLIEATEGGIGWLWDGEVLTPPPLPEVPNDQTDRRITQLAFRNRFTQAEKIAIDLASIDEPAADMPARMQAAAIRVDLADVAAASHINMALPKTRNGVITLEAIGKLAEGRALEILDADIQPDERVQ